MGTRKLGDFAARPTVGAFEPEPDDMELMGSKHGIGLQKSWLYGFFRDADGLTYGVERNFVGSLTSGLFLMTQNGDAASELHVHPDAGRSARGELRRVLEGPTRRWSDPVFQRLPKGCYPEGEQPVELEFSREKLTYSEGDILALAGPSAGLGMQFFVPSLDRPLLYTSTCFWMNGHVQGKEVAGPIWFDNAFWKHGLEWKEYGYFNQLQKMWHVFCNKFDDGTFEWGHLVDGVDGFTPGVVIQSTGEVNMTPECVTEMVLDQDSWPVTSTYRVNDSVYEFVGPVTGRMTQFSESRWAGYRAQLGQTRLVGDTRDFVDGLVWNEGFPQRMGGA